MKKFRDLRYLGQRPPSVTLDEFIEIEVRMHSNPMEVKSCVLEDIRADRLSKGLPLGSWVHEFSFIKKSIKLKKEWKI